MVSESDYFSHIEAVGPYVNIHVEAGKLAHDVITTVQNQWERYGKGESTGIKYLVEWRSPNTHKALHVGHLRNALMSETVCTILEAAGHTVIRTAYGGDIGAHVAKRLRYYTTFDNSTRSNNPEEFCKRAGQLYVDASLKVDEDPDNYKQQIHDVQLALESWDETLNALRNITREMSIKGINSVFDELGCTIEREYFESEVEQTGIDIIKQAEKNTHIPLIKESQGAIIADLEDFKLWVFVVLKHNGTSLYSTKDIALAYLKEKEYDFDHSLYIVATEQNHHFLQLFKTMELLGYDTSKLHHQWYEMVELESGKMSSRKWTVVLYHDYRDNMLAKAQELLTERWLPAHLENEVAHAITFGALKFSMLLQDAYKKIIFDMEKSLSFEGETWPYIQYTYARSCALLRKATDKWLSLDSTKWRDYSVCWSEEKELLLHLASYSDAISRAARDYAPNYVARYVLELASLFNTYYQQVRIFGDDDDTKENQAYIMARLWLVQTVKSVLHNWLSLLWITAPEKM